MNINLSHKLCFSFIHSNQLVSTLIRSRAHQSDRCFGTKNILILVPKLHIIAPAAVEIHSIYCGNVFLIKKTQKSCSWKQRNSKLAIGKHKNRPAVVNSKTIMSQINTMKTGHCNPLMKASSTHMNESHSVEYLRNERGNKAFIHPLPVRVSVQGSVFVSPQRACC